MDASHRRGEGRLDATLLENEDVVSGSDAHVNACCALHEAELRLSSGRKRLIAAVEPVSDRFRGTLNGAFRQVSPILAAAYAMRCMGSRILASALVMLKNFWSKSAVSCRKAPKRRAAPTSTCRA